jgi:hypothetical protein
MYIRVLGIQVGTNRAGIMAQLFERVDMPGEEELQKVQRLLDAALQARFQV